jgi:hypothetical protein
MALTITNEPLNFGGLGMTGGRRFRLSTVDFDSSYPTGGEAVTAANFDLPVAIEAVMLVAITDGADVALDAVFDAENSKIIVHAFDDALEADNATDLSGVSAKFLVIGY